MKIGVVYFTGKGESLYKKILDFLLKEGHEVELRNKEEGLKAWAERCFKEKDAMIFVSATGIAIRTIAPFISSKVTDPAVISMDDGGNFVISLLSGHIGGANELTRDLAKVTKGRAVITTATDVNGKMAIDQWAVENKMVIDDMKMAKEVAMGLLHNKKMGFYSQLPFDKLDELFVPIKEKYQNGEEIASYEVGLRIAYSGKKIFNKELLLVPKVLVLGIGCKRGKTLEEIEKALYEVLENYNIDIRAISEIGSIDLKADEEGILKLADKLGVEFKTFTSHELNQAKGDFPVSEFVRSVTGTDNVCQRAATLLSQGGHIIVKKYPRDGVTISIGVKQGGSINVI